MTVQCDECGQDFFTDDQDTNVCPECEIRVGRDEELLGDGDVDVIDDSDDDFDDLEDEDEFDDEDADDE